MTWKRLERIIESSRIKIAGTRSNIGIEAKNGSIKYIYCHWDGYVNGVGATLLKYYKDPKKIKELIALGDISSLGKEIGKKQDFENPKDDWTLAYGRDRGEKGTKAKSTKNRNSVFQEEYAYIYVEAEKRWIYTEGGDWKDLKTKKSIVGNGPSIHVKIELDGKKKADGVFTSRDELDVWLDREFR